MRISAKDKKTSRVLRGVEGTDYSDIVVTGIYQSSNSENLVYVVYHPAIQKYQALSDSGLLDIQVLDYDESSLEDDERRERTTQEETPA